MLKLLAGRC